MKNKKNMDFVLEEQLDNAELSNPDEKDLLLQ